MLKTIAIGDQKTLRRTKPKRTSISDPDPNSNLKNKYKTAFHQRILICIQVAR